jgi:hypothetical protein
MRPISNFARITKSTSDPTLKDMKTRLSSENLISGLSDESFKALNHSISDTSMNEIVSQCSKGNSDEESIIRYGIDFVGETYQCWTDTGDGKDEIQTFEFLKLVGRFSCRTLFTVISHRIWEFLHSLYGNIEPHISESIHKFFVSTTAF